MKLYAIKNNSWNTKGFAWAESFGALDQMPFLSSIEEKTERELTKLNQLPPGLVIGSSREGPVNKWPDLLGCGSIGISFVSERVIGFLRSANLTPDRITHVPIALIKRKTLPPAPQYYVIEYEQGIAFASCPQAETDDIYDEASWSRKDIFGMPSGHPGPNHSLLCTDQIIEKATREGWTNVRFQAVAIR